MKLGIFGVTIFQMARVISQEAAKMTIKTSSGGQFALPELNTYNSENFLLPLAADASPQVKKREVLGYSLQKNCLQFGNLAKNYHQETWYLKFGSLLSLDEYFQLIEKARTS